MLKKASPKNDADDEKDVPADNPKGTMKRFAEGLRTVLAASKDSQPSPKRTRYQSETS